MRGLNTMMAAGGANPYMVLELGDGLVSTPYEQYTAVAAAVEASQAWGGGGGGGLVCQRLVTKPVLGGVSSEWYDELPPTTP